MNSLQRMTSLFFLFIAFAVNGQGWEETYGGGMGYQIQAADQTLDGGMIMAGFQTDEVANISYPLLLKVDMNGVLQWSFHDTLHSATFVEMKNIIATTDGQYLLSMIYGNNSNNFQSVVQKVANHGILTWTNVVNTSNPWYEVTNLAEFSDGSFALYGKYITVLDATRLIKVSGDGVFQWETLLEDFNYLYQPGDVLVTENDELIVLGYINGPFDYYSFIQKISSSGSIIWEKNYDTLTQDFGQEIEALDDGSFLIAGYNNETFWSYHTPFVLKIDSFGNQLWHADYPNIGDQSLGDLKLTSDGGFVIGGYTDDPAPIGGREFYLLKADSLGNEEWSNTYGRFMDDLLVNISIANDQGYYLAGSTENLNNSKDGYLIKTDPNGISYRNRLEGNIFYDENGDCLKDSTEIGMSQWLVEAKLNGNSYLGLSDENGNYEIKLDSGTYTINNYPIAPYWTSCDSTTTISFIDSAYAQNVNIGATPIIDCPLLNVSIGTPLLRRCFDNTYFIQYSNIGTILAEDAFVEIEFDPDMIITGSSLPIASQSGNTLVFDIGDVPFGGGGGFSVDILLGDSTTCDSILLGATHCVEAHIYPDSICFQNTLWSGASVVVDAECLGDSIQFSIENAGTSPTTPALEYFVIEDDVILMNQSFNLNPGENQTISIATNGSSYLLQADQEPNHPGMSMPSVAVEACATGNPILSYGYLNVFPMDDGDPFVDIDCRSNIGSYDPNDKQGFPLGYGTEHFIEKNQDLEYFIRFQNTGTDTAFTVSIDDELDESLDYTTIRPGASSHPYVYSISEDGLINFHFDNIQLPDSSVDESGSNGFVKFKISQKKDLDLGTKIHNSAAIFFDFNPPIITNQTEHTIGENFVLVSVDPVVNSLAEVAVFPNPFSNRAQFQVKGIDMKEGRFSLYDLTGRLVSQGDFEGDTYFFEKGELLSGMYFFTIESAGVLVASGKVMKQ